MEMEIKFMKILYGLLTLAKRNKSRSFALVWAIILTSPTHSCDPIFGCGLFYTACVVKWLDLESSLTYRYHL